MKKIKEPKYTEKMFLTGMLIYAIDELEAKHKRIPTKGEIMDYLFSEARDDPEGQALEKKMDRHIGDLLDQRL